jgi:hypothetical protein
MITPYLKIKIKLYLRALPSLIIVSLFVIAFMWLSGKHIEGICFIIAFLALRYKFSVTWHSKIEIVCIILTTLLWCFCIDITLNTNVSILSSIFIGFISTYSLWHIQDSNNKSRQIEQLALACNRISKKFDIITCTEQEMIARCREKNLSADNVDIALHYFVYKDMSLRDLSEKYCIDYDSIKQRTRRIKRKIE